MRVKQKQVRKTIARTMGLNSIQSQIGMAVFVLACVIFISMSLANPRFNNFVKTSFYNLTSPVVAMISAPVYAIRDGFDSVTDLTNLRIENEALRLENEKLKKWYWVSKSLSLENQRYQSMLNVVEESSFSLDDVVTARVMADTSSDFGHSFLIAAGTKDGVQEGFPVMADNILIGRVIEVKDDVARILLLSDITAKTPILIARGAEEIRAVMAGDNQNRPYVQFLPDLTGFENGAAVFTSGHGGIYPAGLKIGTLILPADNGPALVQLDIASERIHRVHVLKTTTQPILF